MRSIRRLSRLALVCSVACCLSGCAMEYKLPTNTPTRTQRPSGYFGLAKADVPDDPDRQRAMDEMLRGKKKAVTGVDRPGDVADRSNQGTDPLEDAPASAAPGHRAAAVREEPGPTVEDSSIKGTFYVVRKGDTVFSVARKFDVSPRDIEKWNPKEVHDGLPAGCTIYVPTAVAARPMKQRPPPEPIAQANSIRRNPRTTRVASFRPAPAPAAGTGTVPSRKGSFAWPVAGTIISKFGTRHGRPHTGLDIKAPQGTPIKATMAGKVIYSGVMRGYGKVIILDHQNGYFSVYGHNEANLVKRSSTKIPTMVRKGQVIATIGQTGNATTPHVHFEIRRSNDAIDPQPLLPKRPIGPIASKKRPRATAGQTARV